MDNQSANDNKKGNNEKKDNKKSNKKLFQKLKAHSRSAIQWLQAHSALVIVSTIIIILIILFISGFSIFSLTSKNITANFWDKLWTYFNTDIFRTLLASIAIPIVVYFWTSYEKKREKQIEIEEQKRKDRLAQIIEGHRNKRRETIEKTFDQWNQINSLISEVRFVKLKESDIRDVQFKIASHSIEFGKVIYRWSSRFSILPNIASYFFVSYTNLLYWSAWGIAYSLRNKVDTLSQKEISQERDYKIEINKECSELQEEISQERDYKIESNKECIELQEAFGIFQRGVVSVSFIHLSYILKYSDELLEYIETYIEDEQIQNEFIDLIRAEIEKKFKDNVEKEQEDMNKYRSNWMNYLNYFYNEGKKPSKFIPFPISLSWNKFKKRIILDENNIKQDENDIEKAKFFFKGLLGKMKTDTDSTKRKKILEIDSKISDKTKKEMKENIDNLIKELLYLKLYEFLLFIDKFKMGEIRPPSNKKLLMNNDNSNDKKNKLRVHFNNFNKKISEEKIRQKIPEQFSYNPTDKDYSPKDKDKIYDIIKQTIDNEIKSNSNEYENFMRLFTKEITDTNFMDIVAEDIVQYIRFVGREIRFSHILSPEDDLAPVS